MVNDKSAETGNRTSLIRWIMPFLAGTLLFLGLTSYVVGRYLLPEIPLWGHLLAIGLATLVLTGTLLLIKRSGLA